MKKLIYICLLLPLVAFQSCKKAASPGDNYDFSNPLPPYAEFKALTGLSVKLAANQTTAGTAKVTFITRTALQQDVTVTYSVTGAVNLANQTIVIPKDATTSAEASITIPAKTAPGTAVVTINKVVAADGTLLAIGKDNVAANQKVTITITQL
ncbi:hypothetical protein [Mucilaginibacter antarcticus]|uniref:Calx-beta domain-containing protein n=1 Tax=Mucilaginibacter antarcticus TaxID=1855725 RepID=A0ABW5XPC2_9SPHI